MAAKKKEADHVAAGEGGPKLPSINQPILPQREGKKRRKTNEFWRGKRGSSREEKRGTRARKSTTSALFFMKNFARRARSKGMSGKRLPS